jgi:hypothetical protein
MHGFGNGRATRRWSCRRIPGRSGCSCGTTFFKRARRWLHLLPDPLEEVRYQMRRIRARHGEIGQIKMPEDA